LFVRPLSGFQFKEHEKSQKIIEKGETMSDQSKNTCPKHPEETESIMYCDDCYNIVCILCLTQGYSWGTDNITLADISLHFPKCGSKIKKIVAKTIR
jgi:hypothetical protein